MLLGIPYHAAMPYRLGQEWITAPRTGAPGFVWLAEAIHLFRMPAFFLVAGWFAALLLARRRPADWWRGRMVRLGIPLLAALVTVVPLLNLLCEWPQRPWGQALASFAHEYATSPGYWVRHLWFLLVLIELSGLAALLAWRRPHLAVAMLPDRLVRRPEWWLAAIALGIAAWQAAVIEGFYVFGLATHLWQQALRLDDLLAALPWFALGALLARAPRLRAAFERPSWPLALAALATVALHLATLEAVHPALGRFLSTLAAMAVTRLLLGACRRRFDRPSRLVDALVAGSFVIYLVHLPLVVALTTLADLAHLSPWAAFPLVCAATLALSWAIWLGVRRAAVLRLLYAGEVTASARRAPRT